jgi:sec-independent protein translocase protein TatB
MFEIGWGELVLIAIVALIAIGPKELPTVLRTLGQWMGKIRRMAGEFQGQFQEALREAEMDDLKTQVDELSNAARGLTHYNPLDDDEAGTPPRDEEAPASAAAASDVASAAPEPIPEPLKVEQKIPPAAAPIAATDVESGAAADTLKPVQPGPRP